MKWLFEFSRIKAQSYVVSCCCVKLPFNGLFSPLRFMFRKCILCRFHIKLLYYSPLFRDSSLCGLFGHAVMKLFPIKATTTTISTRMNFSVYCLIYKIEIMKHVHRSSPWTELMIPKHEICDHSVYIIKEMC